MPALSKVDLHSRIVEALPGLKVHSGIADAPLVVSVPGVAGRIAVWAFTLTNPPGGRHPAESKIQLRAPGQGRTEVGNFDGPAGAFKVLIGVDPTDDLFVLWDAYKHLNFAWSKNVQVRLPLLVDARVTGLAIGARRLATGPETILVARGDHLREAIKQRIAA